MAIGQVVRKVVHEVGRGWVEVHVANRSTRSRHLKWYRNFGKPASRVYFWLPFGQQKIVITRLLPDEVFQHPYMNPVPGHEIAGIVDAVAEVDDVILDNTGVLVQPLVNEIGQCLLLGSRKAVQVGTWGPLGCN